MTSESAFRAPGEPLRISLIGGRGAGKSCLFQALAFRAFTDPELLASVLRRQSMELHEAKTLDAPLRLRGGLEFTEAFANWRPHARPRDGWRRLRLFTQTRRGARSAALDVELFDASDGPLLEAPLEPDGWLAACGETRVFVLCLPLWTAFPDRLLDGKDRDLQQRVLESFTRVLQNYRSASSNRVSRRSVSTILALTMSDDARSSLAEVRERWIAPCFDQPEQYTSALRSGPGIARYLTNARATSDLLVAALRTSPEPRLQGLVDELGERTWVVPMSAFEGSVLELQARTSYEHSAPRLPSPAHVELPLLIALCDHRNALM